jgi:shikimate kinase
MEGEDGFRERESKIIDELTTQENVVLAPGGGAILSEENRQHLHDRGMVIYLSATAEQLYRRTAKDKKRPLLQTGDRRKKIEALLAERMPLYQKVAHITLRTSNKSIQHTVNELIKRIKQKTTQK